ncbi:DUF5675 family protein [Roseateles sp. BYS78W]|uniref:DUF5675 family protein n=1 Tax=Pelomonas candidula TaxID=3299025 RepID=A0ABW7HE82_9BURK
MQIQVFRKTLTASSTIGELHLDGQFECYTLEDCVRPVKIKGMTAIPAGSYEVVINFSERFQRLLPLLLNVPNFDGVRIHAGNTAADTEGCLLVGQTQSADFIGKSRAAFDALFPKLQAAAAREKIFINILMPDAGAPAAPARLAMTRPAAKKAATKAGKKNKR